MKLQFNNQKLLLYSIAPFRRRIQQTISDMKYSKVYIPIWLLFFRYVSIEKSDGLPNFRSCLSPRMLSLATSVLVCHTSTFESKRGVRNKKSEIISKILAVQVPFIPWLIHTAGAWFFSPCPFFLCKRTGQPAKSSIHLTTVINF